ncbi:3-isopropylmalate dehydratase large subunit [Acinetobacter baumannii]
MGQTISEKIFARVSGKNTVKPGDEIMARPDFVFAYDFPGYTDVFFRQMREDFGIHQLTQPERYAIFIDHMLPAITPAEEDFHIKTRQWCKEQNVALYERKGIGHQLIAELGYAVPGSFVVHFDGHISQLGALGVFALGMRRGLIEAFVREKVSIRVPETIKLNLHGTLKKGVMARDVFHFLVKKFGPDFCRFKVLEFDGPAIDSLSLGQLQTLTGLTMFTGALTSIINPNPTRLSSFASKYKLNIEPVYSDPDAIFSAEYDVNLNDLEPQIVIPPSPANTRNLKDYIGLEVNAGYLGSCVSGRIEDLRIAAHILKGRKVAPGFQLNIIPTSQEIMVQAGREGLLTIFAEAGAFVSSPSCDYCFGRIATLGDNQRAVSTGTLNVRGRMGNINSEIYLCSAATVAATAIQGHITSPEDYIEDDFIC